MHKALELLAKRKLAEQEGQGEIADDELGVTLKLGECTPEHCLDLSFDYYSKKENHLAWTDKDKRDCGKWVQTVLDWNGGVYSPLQREILAPEVFFNFELDEPWSKYSYTIGGEKLEGRLDIKGSIDLVTQVGPNVLEYLDWKSGQAKDWKKNRPKDYDSVIDDLQFRLYHLALDKTFPWAEQIIFTVFYVAEKKPFTVFFDKDDIRKTKEILRRKFEEIRACERPRLVWGSKDHWKCKICDFSQPDDTGKPHCHTVRDEIVQLGFERVFQKYGSIKKLTSYADGGGKSNRE